MNLEADYQRLFELSPQAMFVTDSRTLAILAVNDAALRQYGYTREEILGMPATLLRAPEDREQLLAYVASLPPDHHIPVSAGVFRHLKKDGACLEVEVTHSRSTFQGADVFVVFA